MDTTLIERARAIRTVIFDVDGVLTDGSLFLGDDGQEYKAFHSRDGHGMTMLKQAGIQLAVITGRESHVVRLRMASLGITQVYQGFRNKRPAYDIVKSTLQVSDAACAYVGDDIMDIPILRQVGLAVAVADAHPTVKNYAHWVTTATGGHGAAREVCEMILDAQGVLSQLIDSYSCIKPLPTDLE
jgi:3-deoxy-D-manno-octulosonate 8-phosphate phosphatase (KDO 8-P phosphatase)